MFGRILIGNRGEIAVRIARTCRRLNVGCVAIYSDPDSAARHVDAADEAVHLPGTAPAETYLNAQAIIHAAQQTGSEAIHPGYGFLSESAEFARTVEDAGLVWVGPPARAIAALGDKISARRVALEAGVPVVPGLTEPLTDVRSAAEFAAEHGYPVVVKASSGGGGRGLKVVESPDELPDAFESARREARSYFGSDAVYVERYLDAPKHLEVQLLAPGPDEALWLGVRDCSLQRRHQKLLEETPPPRWAGVAADMGAAAVALSKAAGYVNAGTVEMLVDPSGDFYFLEVNSRLQVEHTITEELFDVDLVECQLEIASGEPLGFSQADLEARGHAIECRINAEDPARGFLPSPGTITAYEEPSGVGVRIDSGYREGDEVSGAYDSLIAKVIVHAEDRVQAIAKIRGALSEFIIDGVATTMPAHLELLSYEAFTDGSYTTRTLESEDVLGRLQSSAMPGYVLMVEGVAVRLWSPEMAAFAAAATASASGDVKAPMQGTILDVVVRQGESVEAGQPVAVLEAMKMESTVVAPRSGSVVELRVAPGDTTGAGDVIAVIE